MSDPYSGVARVDFINMLFEQEMLPYSLGWQPSTSPITLLTLGQMIVELTAANGADAVPEGVEITVDSYKDVFEGIQGVSEILGNLTLI